MANANEIRELDYRGYLAAIMKQATGDPTNLHGAREKYGLWGMSDEALIRDHIEKLLMQFLDPERESTIEWIRTNIRPRFMLAPTRAAA